MLTDKDCLVSLFHFLFKAADRDMKLPLPMPQSICYEHHFPRGWYQYEPVEATRHTPTPTFTITRKAPKECDTASIRAVFGKKAPGVLCAQVVHRDDAGRVVVEYKDKKGLEAFLLHTYELCVLSKFVKPKKNSLRSNDGIVATWTPSVFQVEQWASRTNLHDVDADVQLRGETTKPSQCTELLCAPLLARKAKECLQYIVDVAYRIERKKITEIRATFKQDSSTQLWLLWVDSVTVSTWMPRSMPRFLDREEAQKQRRKMASPLYRRTPVEDLEPSGQWPSFCAPKALLPGVLEAVDRQMSKAKHDAEVSQRPNKPSVRLAPGTADPVVPMSQRYMAMEPEVFIVYLIDVDFAELLEEDPGDGPRTPPPTPKDWVPVLNTSIPSPKSGAKKLAVLRRAESFVSKTAPRTPEPSRISIQLKSRYSDFRSQLRSVDVARVPTPSTPFPNKNSLEDTQDISGALLAITDRRRRSSPLVTIDEPSSVIRHSPVVHAQVDALRDTVYGWYCDALSLRPESPLSHVTSAYFELPPGCPPIPERIRHECHVTVIHKDPYQKGAYGIENVKPNELVEYGGALCVAMETFLFSGK